MGAFYELFVHFCKPSASSLLSVMEAVTLRGRNKPLIVSESYCVMRALYDSEDEHCEPLRHSLYVTVCQGENQ